MIISVVRVITTLFRCKDNFFFRDNAIFIEEIYI